MNKIKQLTEVIKNNSENELCYGTLRTLKMIEDESENLELRITKKNHVIDILVKQKIKLIKKNEQGKKIALEILNDYDKYVYNSQGNIDDKISYYDQINYYKKQIEEI